MGKHRTHAHGFIVFDLEIEASSTSLVRKTGSSCSANMVEPATSQKRIVTTPLPLPRPQGPVLFQFIEEYRRQVLVRQLLFMIVKMPMVKCLEIHAILFCRIYTSARTACQGFEANALTFNSQVREGRAIFLGHTRLVPRAQALTFTSSLFGFVWNRPHSLTVEQDGITHTLPIIDHTRLLQALLWGLTLGFSILSLRRFSRSRRSSRNGGTDESRISNHDREPGAIQ